MGAVGLYLPAELGPGLFFGALFRYAGEKLHERNTGKFERTYESILAVAGMITGAAMLDLIVGILVILGVDTKDFRMVGTEGEDMWLQYVFSGLNSLFLCFILFYNALYGIPEASNNDDTGNKLAVGKGSKSSLLSQ